MKHRIFILSVVTAALIIFGCGQEGLVSPQLTQSDHGGVLAKATVTSFTATVPLQTVLNPGVTTVTPGGVVQVRGQVITGPISGGITGTLTVVFNTDIVPATGKGPGYGTFTIVTAGGDWNGRFDGQNVPPVFSGHVTAQGSAGLTGTIQGAFTDAANPLFNVFILTGTMITP